MNSREEFNLDEISVYGILRKLFRNIWMVVFAAAGAWLLVTGVKGMTWEPQYTSHAVLAVNSRGTGNDAYSSLTLTNQMAGVFSEVFSSQVLKEKIAESLGQDQIDARIFASVVKETNLIEVSVIAREPREAYLILQSAIENYHAVSDYLFSNAVLRVIQEPDIPFGPSNPLRINKLRILAAAGAAVVVCGLIVLFSALRFTVQTRAGARRNLDGRILAVLPFERKYKTFRELVFRRKKSILLSSPLIGIGFSESVEKLASLIGHHMNRREQKVLLVSSVCENEGKSSVAANIALALSEQGKRVLLIDADLKKPALWRIFDCDVEHPDLKLYLEGQAEMEKIIEEQEELAIIFQRTPVKQSSVLLDSPRFEELIKGLRNDWDYILLDSSPMAITSDAEFLLKWADTALLVVRQDWADIRAVNEAADAVRQSGADFMGVVLNAFCGERTGAGRGYGSYGYKRYSRIRTKEE